MADRERIVLATTSSFASGATIIQEIIVGPHCLIGAVTLVRNNVPAGATVIGVPGRIT